MTSGKIPKNLMKRILPNILALGLCCGTLASAQDQTPAPEQTGQLLPQRSEFQRTLRDYLATFTAKDFEIPDGKFVYDEAWLSNPDNLFKTWLITNDQFGRNTRGILDLSSEAFTLKEIESPEGVRLRARQDLFPASLLFWADWEYPGNPFRNSQGIRNRVLAFSIVDMIMLDSAHLQDNAQSAAIKRPDYLGGSLIWSAMVYSEMKDTLPENVRRAYEEAFNRFVDRLHKWGPSGGLGNMDSMGLVAMAYIEKSVDDKKLAAKARDFARRIIEKVVSPAGYVTDGGTTDITYNGLALYHMAWASRLSGWDFLDEGTRRLLKFKYVMTFPDPDGLLWGPSHFSSRTSGDAANDQWAFPHRQYGVALNWPDIAGYLVFEGRQAPRLPDEEKMRDAIQKTFAHMNKVLNESKTNPPRKTNVWSEEHFDARRNWAYAFYQPGEYQMLRKAWEERPDWTKAPLQVPGENRVNLDNQIIFNRFPNYATLLHTGHIGRYQKFIYGLGGGTLSAFWTPKTGSVILSRRRGHQHDNADRLDEWRIWPVHALSGLNAEGKMFTSARVRQPKVEVENIGETDTRVRLTGTIGDELSAPDQSLKEPIVYERDFTLAENGLTYATRISGEGLKEASELYEILPVFLGDPKLQPDAHTEIYFVADGKETPASTEPQKVSAIRIQRFGGSVTIQFDQPRTVHLSPEIWKDTYQSRVEERNIMIPLLPKSGDSKTSGPLELKYRIFETPADTEAALSREATPPAPQK